MCFELSELIRLSVSVSLQVAIVQFSDDARTEFQLNSHGNKEAMLEAIQRIRYKGGNTKTGQKTSLLMLNQFMQWNQRDTFRCQLDASV